jgi:hypothetical protein
MCAGCPRRCLELLSSALVFRQDLFERRNWCCLAVNALKAGWAGPPPKRGKCQIRAFMENKAGR